MSKTIIRARQPVITRITPHNANKKFLIPKRNPAARPPARAFQFNFSGNGHITLPISMTTASKGRITFTYQYIVASAPRRIMGNDSPTNTDRLRYIMSALTAPNANGMIVNAVTDTHASLATVSPFNNTVILTWDGVALSAQQTVNGAVQTAFAYTADTGTSPKIILGNCGVVPSAVGLVGTIKDVGIDFGNDGNYDHYYRIDEGAGTTIYDLIGSANGVLTPGGGSWGART